MATKSIFPKQEQMIFWTIVAGVTVFLISVLGTVLTPFITGMAIAYLLNPAVTGLSRYMPRSVACLIVLTSFALVVTGIVMGLSPMIGRQLNEFFHNLPEYIDKLTTWGCCTRCNRWCL